MARKKHYNKATKYVITLNGEYYDGNEKDQTLRAARKKVRNMRTKKGVIVHIIRQVITETVIDVFKPISKPIWTSASLDGEL